MNATLKRKSDRPEISVDWVDDNEWNAIELVFDAISNRGVDRSDSSRAHPSAAAALSMVPSILSTSAVAHRFSNPSSTLHSSLPRPILDCSKRRDDSVRTVNPNPNAGGAQPWRNVGLRCQYPSRDVYPGGGSRSRSAEQCPDFSSDDCVAGEQTLIDSSLPASEGQDLLPPTSFPGEIASGTARLESAGRDSETIQPGENEGTVESSKERPRRMLPVWMEPGGQSMSNSNSVERISGLSSVEGAIASQTGEEGPAREVLQSTAEQGRISSSMQQTTNGPPAWVQLEQVPAGLPWGLQPASFVDEIKPKFPTMQFRGEIVYSKTESEVNSATLELWQRVRQLQETTRGAIPMGFDLEWRASFERGEIPRKVAVIQLCLDGRRCDVMQIIYSGIPSVLQEFLEAPSTLKVGVGVHGDASKLRQDYQIVTRKLVDLRVVANQKMSNLKQWSLSSLALELTGKQVEKIQSIRCGDWEALPLSQPQLQYAATDAFASLHLYQVLASFPNPDVNSNQNDSYGSKSDLVPPAT